MGVVGGALLRKMVRHMVRATPDPHRLVLYASSIRVPAMSLLLEEVCVHGAHHPDPYHHPLMGSGVSVMCPSHWLTSAWPVRDWVTACPLRS